MREGEVHVLLGENGAGKSTLMKILSGAYRKDAGHIILGGRDVEIGTPRRAAELGIGIIYQEFSLVPSLTVAENIALGREPTILAGIVDRAAIKRMARAALAGLAVDIDPQKRIKELGVAQQQMIEIAKAISRDARILIMDEPTSALTEREITELFARIRELKKQGVSIIYISHRLEELSQIGDRVTVLRDGRRIDTCSIDGVTRAGLIQMMAGREIKDQVPKSSTGPGQEVLRVEGLSKRGFLENVSFTLRRGEVLGITGLLGSGRTTLARTIFGVEQADSGQIHVNGRLRRIRSVRSAIASGIGFVTEDRRTEGLVLPLSVRDNVCLPSIDRFSKFGVMNTRQETRASGRFVDELRIKTAGLNQAVMYLSGGNQQKVVLSKWLCRESDILILDEPTRGVDVASKTEIYELMNQITARGVAIIMMSSELPEVLAMSDRILVMRQGAIKGELAAADATQEMILRCALGD